MKKNQDIFWIILFAILLRLFFLYFTPLYPENGLLPGYNDEPLHLHYVEYVASGGGWPQSIPHDDNESLLTDEFGQPPTYYFLAAPMYKLGEAIRDSWGIYGARLVSVFFGLIAGLFIYHTALIWFRDEKIALSALAAVLFAPNPVIFTTLVTNDSLLLCMSALALHSLVICRTGGGNAMREVITGVFLAATVWAKRSGLCLIPLFWFAASPEMSSSRAWGARIRVLLVAVLLILPLELRRFMTGGGINLIPGTVSGAYSPEQAVGVVGGAILHPLSAIMTFLRLSAFPFMDQWGPITEKIVTILWIAFWGGVFILGSHRLLKEKSRHIIFFAGAFLVLAGFIIYNINQYQVEFRLLMPAFPAMAMIVAKGAVTLRIPPLIQGAIWCLPVVIILFL